MFLRTFVSLLIIKYKIMKDKDLIKRLVKYRQTYNDLPIGEFAERTRYLGAIELLLQMLGGLEGGATLPYEEIKTTKSTFGWDSESLSFGTKEKTTSRKETYKELLFRIADEIINEWFKNLK